MTKKLTREQVAKIKSDHRRPARIAEDYPVNVTAIHKIKSGENWIDVKPKIRGCAHDNHVVLDQTHTLDGHKVEFWECKDCGKEIFYLED